MPLHALSHADKVSQMATTRGGGLGLVRLQPDLAVIQVDLFPAKASGLKWTQPPKKADGGVWDKPTLAMGLRRVHQLLAFLQGQPRRRSEGDRRFVPGQARPADLLAVGFDQGMTIGRGVELARADAQRFAFDGLAQVIDFRGR